MMKSGIKISILAAVLFLGSFAGTRITRSQMKQPIPPSTHTPIAEWLGLDEEQETVIREHDPDFPEDLSRLRIELDKARDRLIASFEDPEVSNEQLSQQFEKVFEAHDRLERRVAGHLITIRHYLSPVQQKKLFNLCAKNIREGQIRNRRRHGQRRREIIGSGDLEPEEGAAQNRGGQGKGDRVRKRGQKDRQDG